MTKQFAQAADRNRHAIAERLTARLPDSGEMLEIASGTGQHAVHLAAALPGWTWQPTDVTDEALASIAAYRAESGLPNLLAPVRLDVTTADWPVERADAMLCVNMIHATPWACTEGLIAGAGRVLAPDGELVLYGPYRVGGAFTTESNASFDLTLRNHSAAWGIRDIEALDDLAAEHGLARRAMIDTPVNNFTVVYGR